MGPIVSEIVNKDFFTHFFDHEFVLPGQGKSSVAVHVYKSNRPW